MGVIIETVTKVKGDFYMEDKVFNFLEKMYYVLMCIGARH